MRRSDAARRSAGGAGRRRSRPGGPDGVAALVALGEEAIDSQEGSLGGELGRSFANPPNPLPGPVAIVVEWNRELDLPLDPR